MRQTPPRHLDRLAKRQAVTGRGRASPNGGGGIVYGEGPAPQDPGPLMAGGSLTDVYHEVCEHIRATDDISLKLLAAVPLATGIGITLLIRSPTEALPDSVRSALS